MPVTEAMVRAAAECFGSGQSKHFVDRVREALQTVLKDTDLPVEITDVLEFQLAMKLTGFRSISPVWRRQTHAALVAALVVAGQDRA